MFSRVLFGIFGPFFALFVLTGAALAAPPPAVAWSETPLALTAPAGGGTTASVRMTVAKRLNDVRLVLSPSIAPFIVVSPNQFDRLLKGETRTLSLTVVVPAGVAPQTYAGTLDVWVGKKTREAQLQIGLTVVAATPPNQAVLGPLAGAEIRAHRLDDLVTPVEGPLTADPSLTDLARAGTFRLSLSGIPDDAWILVTASGGQDIDADDDGILDDSPTANSGTLHAVGKASDWRAGGLRINVLTEMAWQQVVSAAQAGDTARLAAGLQWAANVLLRQDLGIDGVLNYRDLLQFNPLDPLKDKVLTVPFSQLQATSTGALSVIQSLLAWDEASLVAAIAALYGDTLALPVAPDLVDVSPRIELPPNRQGLTAADAAVRSLISDTALVDRNGHTVLMAEDAAGKTLLLGYAMPAVDLPADPTPPLQEVLAVTSQSAVEISPRSTAVALVMMIAASGMDQEGKLAIAEALLQHPQFDSLVADVTAAFQSNAYFLDSLGLYADLVAKIETIARELFDAYQAQFVGAAPLVHLQALAASDAETKTFCDGLWDWLCRSPWNADEPWTWYGTATLFDVWNPPFMALSEKDLNLAAYANPAMVLYAAEGFDQDGADQNWGLVKRNSSAINKTWNSGAAQTLLRLDDTWLTAQTAHIEFTKYRMTLSSVPGIAVSALNMSHAMFSALGLASSTIQLSGNKFLETLLNGAVYQGVGWAESLQWCVGDALAEWETLSGVAVAGLEGYLTVSTNATQAELAEGLRSFFVNSGLKFIDEVPLKCVAKVGLTQLGTNLFEALGANYQKALAELAARIGNPLGWATVVFKAVNDTLPLAVSLLTPTNGMAGYDLEWTGSQLTGATRNDARPTGSTGSPLVRPQAHFNYSQETGITIRFDASASIFDPTATPVYRWDFGDGGGSVDLSDPIISWTYAEPGNKTVILRVSDSLGYDDEVIRLVEVTDGHPPQVDSLACSVDPTQPTSVSLQFSVSDEDADLASVELYLDASSDSPEKTLVPVAEDAWTSNDTLLYPDDGVKVYAPVLVVYDAGGNKDSRACNPVSLVKVGTYPLNDTGLDWCANASQNNLACPVSGFPGQDAEYGRDVTHNDDSDGQAGFSFTKIANSGNALPNSAALGSGANDWGCTRDNVTGLIWEVKTNDNGLRDQDWTYSWYNPDAGTNGGSAGYADYGNNCFNTARCDTDKFVADVNAQGLCGASDWRLPNRFELESLTSNDRYGPAIDTAFFPNTPSRSFWSSSPYAGDPYYAWDVYFGTGDVYYYFKYSARYVRLVRGGQ